MITVDRQTVEAIRSARTRLREPKGHNWAGWIEIVLPANGDWNVKQHTVIVDLKGWQIDAALSWWRAKRPVESACQSRNRAVRTT